MNCRCEGAALCNHGERCPKERAHAHLPERGDDAQLRQRLVVGLICFWMVLVFGVPALLNACARAAS